ncbi:Protein translocase subunit SecA [Dirofilaria immitis]
MIGSDKRSNGSAANRMLLEFDAEYACSDHAMVHHVVQTAMRNYFSASCVSPAHMTLCIDFTEGAPIPTNSAPVVRYQAPLVQINVERKFDSVNSSIATTTENDGELLVVSKSEKASREKVGVRKQGPIFNAAKKLSVFTIKEDDDENLKPLKAVTVALKSKIPLLKVYYLKCIEKKRAEKKIFEYLSAGYAKFISQEMIMEWRKKYEEDKRTLYSDQQATSKDGLSSPATICSDVNISVCETGMITEDQQMNEWGGVTGILDFEPKDSRGNVSKAIQIRGSLPNTL